jgi:hypothetical protein
MSKDPNKKTQTVTIELDMTRISYARVKKVGESTTDIRFREPEKTTSDLRIAPEDDFVAFPTPDRSKIIFIRVDKVVTRDTIQQSFGFLSSDSIETVMSTIEAGRHDFMREVGQGRPLKILRQKTRRKSRKR